MKKEVFSSDILNKLAAELQSGDKKTFENCYDKLSPIIYGMLVKMLNNEEAAGTLMQRTFIQALRNKEEQPFLKQNKCMALINTARSYAFEYLAENNKVINKEKDIFNALFFHHPSFKEASATLQKTRPELMKSLRVSINKLRN